MSYGKDLQERMLLKVHINGPFPGCTMDADIIHSGQPLLQLCFLLLVIHHLDVLPAVEALTCPSLQLLMTELFGIFYYVSPASPDCALHNLDDSPGTVSDTHEPDGHHAIVCYDHSLMICL